ncbi:MAG TPA: DinB family protein [Bryobacteraceae bacterium]|nr:DinB family protein [Bryobacteraceae bacterium]
MVRPDSVLNSWKAVREDTAQAVEDFSAQPLDYKPVPELMSFGEIGRHILEAGYALTGILLEGVDNLATPQFREMLHKHVAQLPPAEGAGALARELRAAMESRFKELTAQPADFFAGEIIRMDGQRATRLEVLQMMKEHELTHRAQLFVYLRLKGMVPPTTRRRMAKANA